ncbi:MAG: hypothetical protein ACI4D9_09410 [Lachnospiraceae bacterium]
MRKYQITAKEIKSSYDKSMAIHYAALVDEVSREIDKMLNVYDLGEKTSINQNTLFDDNISDPLRGTEILSQIQVPPIPPMNKK